MRTRAQGWQRRAAVAADLPARLALGGAMLYHGLQKLRGEGPAQTAQMFEGLGIRPGRFWAMATGVAETAAGALAVLGIATRPAALAVIATQAVAIRKVHAPKGYSIMNGGMEYNLALVAIALGLLTAGPGPVSARSAAVRAMHGRGLLRRVRPSTGERALNLLG